MPRRAEQLIDEITGLLNLLDGVSIVDSRRHVDSLAIEFTVNCPKSRLMLTYCAEAANVKLNSWAQHNPNSNEALTNPDEALHYRYQSSRHLDDTVDPEGDFEALGAFISWQMYENGIISGEEEKRLSNVFNAISRSL